MVPPAPTAAQSQAPEAAWLSELRRWLTLGRKGVIVMVRDAQPARLRELVVALEEVEPGFCFTDDATVIAELAPGSLVLLALRRDALDWLNLNRPLFAERSLRVVLWAQGELAVQLKFLAPDLHDWVSHFVACPPGVPQFAVEGLAQGVRWWPGVAWTGAGLELAMARVPGLEDCLELDPSRDYSELVEALEEDAGRCVVWRNVQNAMQLWRVRWALAEARHTGANILYNPQIGAPGWYPVCSNQLELREAVSIISGDDRYRRAVLAELEPGAITGMVKDEADIEEIGLLRETGPALRRLHESPAVEEWREALVRRMRGSSFREQHWSRDEMAIFAACERRRISWPDWDWTEWVAHLVEHHLSIGTDAKHKGELLYWVAWAGHQDIVAHWRERWGSDVEALKPTVSAAAENQILNVPMLLIDEPESHLHPKGAEKTIALGASFGWNLPLAWRLLVLQAAIIGGRNPADLPDFLKQVACSAAEQLGPTDPEFLFISRLLGLAAGAYAHPGLAHSYLDEPARVAEQRRYPLLARADLELSVILTMLGRYEAALDQFNRAPTNDSDHSKFERFHQLTHAAQGHPTLPLDTTTDQPLSTRIDTEARALLRERLLQLGNIQDQP